EVVTPQELGIKFWHKDPICYRKLAIFSKRAKEVLGGKVLSIDLDCVILKDITPLVTDDPLKVMRGHVCPYNTSIVLHKTGTLTSVWDGFSLKKSPTLLDEYRQKTGEPFVGSDQAWLAYTTPNAALWDDKDGVYQYNWIKGK